MRKKTLGKLYIFLREKRISFVFDVFGNSLLNESQSFNSLRNLFSLHKTLPKQEFLIQKMASLAEISLLSHSREVRSLKNKLNRSGPNMEPCGTPL